MADRGGGHASLLARLLQRAVRPSDEDEFVHGKPGPVLDPAGRPRLDSRGEPVRKVLVPYRRDTSGYVTEWLYVDPRLAWQWEDRP